MPLECRDLSSFLPAYVDGEFEGTETAEIEDHLTGCADCRREVSMQEMLHMVLAANVLNAVGGKPNVADPEFVPGYPTNLPWHAPGFRVGLERFSRSQLEVFAQIEAPAPRSFFSDRPELQQIATRGDAAAGASLPGFAAPAVVADDAVVVEPGAGLGTGFTKSACQA